MLTEDQFIERFRSDLRDVALWLRTRYHGRPVRMLVDRNYASPPGILSHVVIVETDRDRRHGIRASATKALEALGYTMAPTGGDVFDTAPAPHDHLSAHQVLRCVRRVRRALDGEYSPPYDFDRREPPQNLPFLDDNF